MKNLKFIAFTIVAMLFTVTNVYAQEVGTADELSSCIATDGNTCTLTADITVETKLSFAARKTITIDLSGHKIKLEGSNTQIFVYANGNLIINDSVGGGLITNAESNAGNQYPVQVAGSLVINGGTLENARPNLNTVFVQGEKGSCTLNNGTIINSYDKGGKAIYLNNNKGVFTMNGGKVESKAAGSTGVTTAIEGTQIKINGGTIVAAGTAITATAEGVEITGGTINAGYFALHTRYATIKPAEGKQVNITAGTAAIIAYSAPTAGKGNKVYGGNFESPLLIIASGYSGSDPTNVEVHSGTYKMDVSDYVVDGKYAEKVGEVYEIKEYTQTPDITPVDPEEEVEDTTIGVTDNEETGDILMDSLEEVVTKDEELQEAIKNTNVVVVVDVISKDVDELDEEVLENIENASKDLVIADYFDINVLINDDEDNTLGVITELTKEIELIVLLPEKLINTDKNIERKYYIVREHDGQVEIIDDVKLSDDGKSLIFSSNKFSTYAIAYEDVKNELPPKTGDGAVSYFALAMMSLLSMAGIALVSKKQFN